MISISEVQSRKFVPVVQLVGGSLHSRILRMVIGLIRAAILISLMGLGNSPVSA